MINNIIDQLKRDEGFVDHIYIDSVGKRTIGYGHNLDANPVFIPEPFTEQYADLLLTHDLIKISNKLTDNLPWTTSLEVVRFGVFQNMSFNMGVNGLLEFKHFIEYVRIGKYGLASFEMLNSLWARQVHERAFRLSIQMKTGVWQ